MSVEKPPQGPSYLDQFLIGADNFFDRVPIFSTLTNAINLVIRGVLNRVYATKEPTSHYYRHLMLKDTTKCVKLLVPGMNIYVATHVSPYEKGKYYEKMGDTKSALEAYKEGEEQQDPNSCYELFVYHRSKYPGIANLHLKRAAKYGHPEAMKELVDRIQQNQETLFDVKHLLGDADTNVKFNLGLCLLKTDNKDLRKEGVEVLRDLAHQDNREAQYELSKVTPSKEAAEWLKKAADKGHKQAQYDLGLHYLAEAKTAEPFQVKQYEEHAEKYFSMAAKQGYEVAQCEVHWCKWKSREEGPNWMRNAAFKGIPRAMYHYGRALMENLNAENQIKGIGLLQKAADKGEIDAKYYLGKSLLKGIDPISTNEQEAVKLLMDAAKGGHKKAIYKLGIYLVEHREAEFKDEVVKLLQDLADYNDAKAQFHLGMYFLKQEDPNAQESGEALLSKAADQNNADAQYELGMHFLRGGKIKGAINLLHRFLTTTDALVKKPTTLAHRNEAMYELALLETKDKDEASQKYGWESLTALAHSGYPEAQYIVGMKYSENSQQKIQDEGLKFLEKAVRAGHVEAAYQRAIWALKHGERINRKPYFRKAADAGHTQAQFALAIELMDGWNQNWDEYTKVPTKKPMSYEKSLEEYQAEEKEKNKPRIEQLLKDRAECIQLLEKAAEKKYAPAQYSLGICYRDGWGVDKDPEKAVQLFRLAENYGHAEFALANCYRDGVGVPKDPQQYSHFLEMAAEHNHSEAQYILGKALLDKDSSKAVDLLRKAVQNNHIYAQYELGKYLLSSTNSELIKEAEGLLDKFINISTGGDPNQIEATYILGQHYVNSPDGDTRKKGFELLLLAAQHNQVEACVLVSKCYTSGTGTGVDAVKAQYWANKAEGK